MTEFFFSGMIIGALGGVAVTLAVVSLRGTNVVRRDRRNRLELPGDRVYRGRR